jgi:hypothetical protein
LELLLKTKTQIKEFFLSQIRGLAMDGNTIPYASIKDMAPQASRHFGEADHTLIDRFSSLLLGTNQGLRAGETILNKAVPNNALTRAPKNLQEGIVNDVMSMEKGVRSVMELTNKSVRHNAQLEKDDNIGPMAEVFYDYTQFTLRYFVINKYIHNKATGASEEIQIFSKGK